MRCPQWSFQLPWIAVLSTCFPLSALAKRAVILDGCVLQGGENIFLCGVLNGFLQVAAELLEHEFVRLDMEPARCTDWVATNAKAYDVILFPGFQYDSCISDELAANHSSTWFLGIDTSTSKQRNVVHITFKEEEPAFVAGYLAGLVSETQVLGVIGGVPVPAVVRFTNGFAAGVRAACAECKVEGVYINSFGFGLLGNATAEFLIGEKGADIIFGAGGGTGSAGILRAADLGAHVIGVDVDEYLTTFKGKDIQLRSKLISSAMKLLNVGTYEGLRRALAANPVTGVMEGVNGNNLLLDYQNNGVGTGPCHDACDFVGEAAAQLVQQIEVQMAAGGLEVGLVGRRDLPPLGLDSLPNVLYEPLSVSSRPPARIQHAMTRMSGFWKEHVVVFGGIGGDGFLNDLWFYEIVSSRWVHSEHGVPVVGGRPPALAGACAMPAYLGPPHLNGAVIIYGGRTEDNRRSNSVHTFADQPGLLGLNSRTDPLIRFTWSHPPNAGEAPPPTDSSSCAVLNSSCFMVFGGRGDFTEWDTLHLGCHAFDGGHVEWTMLWPPGRESAPASRQQAGMAVVEGAIVGVDAAEVLVVVGGSSAGFWLHDVWAFALPPAPAAWHALPNLPQSLSSTPVVFTSWTGRTEGEGLQALVIQPASKERASGFDAFLLVSGSSAWETQGTTSSPEVERLGDISSMRGVRADGLTWMFGGGLGASRLDAFMASRFEVQRSCLSGFGLRGSSCEECPAGSFSPGGKGIVCQPCQEGFFASTPRSAVCLNCPAGSFINSTGAVACKLCPAGTASDGSLPFLCQTCEAGSFSKAAGERSCSFCDPGTFQEMRGATACKSCKEETGDLHLWTLTAAATSEAACICDRGFFRAKILPQDVRSDPCLPCPEGMVCDQVGSSREALECVLEQSGRSSTNCTLGGMNQTAAVNLLLGAYPVLAEKFMARSWDIFRVFKCPEDSSGCQGGLPGICAEGHDSNAVACAACVSGFAFTSGRDCSKCENTQAALIALLLLAVILLLLVVLVAAVGRDVVVRSQSSVTFVAVVGITVIFFQGLGLVAGLQVRLRNPIKALAATLRVVSLDWDFLHFGCVTSMTATAEYIVLQLLLGGCAIIVLMLCYARRLLRHHRSAKSGMKPFMEAGAVVSSLIKMLFLALSTTILAPWVCYQHPEGSGWSVTDDPATLCWESDDHRKQLIVSVVSFSVYIMPFIAFVAYGTLGYRVMLRSSDASRNHLVMFHWLFMRFKPEAYYFGSIVLARDLLLTFIPVVISSDTVLQVVLISGVFMCYMMVQLPLQPWRSQIPNMLDGCLAVFLVLLLMCAISPASDATWILMGTLLFSFLGILLMVCMVYFVRMRMRAWLWRQYQAFLCHHKLGSGCLARLLKMKLTTGQYSVFIDTDDLTDLDGLFEVVMHSTGHLVILATSQICLRPWCVGEMVSAKHAGVKTTKVMWVGYQDPSQDFVEHYENYADPGVLYERGMTLERIQDALQWLSSLHKILTPSRLSSKVVDELCIHITKQKAGTIEFKAESSPEDAEALICLDGSNMEVLATAYVIIDMLRDLLVDDPGRVPRVLPAGRDVPTAATLTVILLSCNALQSQEFLAMLVQVCTPSVNFVPVTVDPNFTFPTDDEIARADDQLASEYVIAGVIVATIIRQLFKSICVTFQPSAYTSSEAALRVKARELLQRLRVPGKWGTAAATGSRSSVSNPNSDCSSSVSGDKGQSRRASQVSISLQVGEGEPVATLLSAEDAKLMHV